MSGKNIGCFIKFFYIIKSLIAVTGFACIAVDFAFRFRQKQFCRYDFCGLETFFQRCQIILIAIAVQKVIVGFAALRKFKKINGVTVVFIDFYQRNCPLLLFDVFIQIKCPELTGLIVCAAYIRISRQNSGRHAVGFFRNKRRTA